MVKSASHRVVYKEQGTLDVQHTEVKELTDMSDGKQKLPVSSNESAVKLGIDDSTLERICLRVKNKIRAEVYTDIDVIKQSGAALIDSAAIESKKIEALNNKVLSLTQKDEDRSKQFEAQERLNADLLNRITEMDKASLHERTVSQGGFTPSSDRTLSRSCLTIKLYEDQRDQLYVLAEGATKQKMIDGGQEFIRACLDEGLKRLEAGETMAQVVAKNAAQ